MKKLLLALMTVSFTTNVFAKIYVLEQKNIFVDKKVYVVTALCINEHVFIQTDGDAITQMMKQSWKSSRGTVIVPYQCSQYLEDINKD